MKDCNIKIINDFMDSSDACKKLFEGEDRASKFILKTLLIIILSDFIEYQTQEES